MLAASMTGLLALALSTAGRLGEGEGFLYQIKTDKDFDKLSIPSILPGVERSLKFLAPARDGDPNLLPVVFQNVNQYLFHGEFMAAEFPEKFPGLIEGGQEYLDLVEHRASRSYYAGVIYRFGGTTKTYGFDIFTPEDDLTELPRVNEAKWVFDHLTPNFALGPVAYSPRNPQAIKNAQGWVNPGFPVNTGGFSADYIAYTIAQNYGQVRILSQDEFDKLSSSGEISSQDILVLMEAPSDIQNVIAGICTDTVHDELGHLSIRMARRGTPNAYIKDATKLFAPYQGKLVRLNIQETSYEVAEATLEEAQAWWSTHRPPPVVIPEANHDYDRLDSASEIPPDVSLTLNGRYGGKGANFGRLYHIVAAEHRDNGFVIPLHYYFEYVQTTMVQSRLHPEATISLADYITELLGDPTFQADSHTRFVELDNLRNLFEQGEVDPAFKQKVIDRIREVFGGTGQFVRFRSSSNAEHFVDFNGAGLYDSSKACADDDLDSDRAGPSRCNTAGTIETQERTVAHALKKVWGSLWTSRGYEERAYFSIPQTAVGMGILASESFGDEERVNAVAFTGNPALRGDPNYLINCQIGDVEVVLPPPGVVPEKDLLEVDNGKVVSIHRLRPSSLASPGQVVLTDDQLKEIGGVMTEIKNKFPVYLGTHSFDDVIFDIEFKINKEGRLVFKDTRFFVVPTAPPKQEFHLIVPDGFVACGSFVEKREARNVLKLKVMVGFKAGEQVLRAGGSPGDLFEWIQFDPSGPRIPPKGPGTWVVDLFDTHAGRGYLSSTYQDFEARGEPVRVSLDGLFRLPSDPRDITMDPAAITFPINPYGIYCEVNFPDDPPDIPRHTPLLPCDLTHLPLYTVDVDFGSGDSVHLEERFQDLDEGTGPAELVKAEVNLAGETRTVEDYWHLVYTAGHHNDFPWPEHWVIFDPVIDYPGVGAVKVLDVIRGFTNDQPKALLLGDDFQQLAPLQIVTYYRHKTGVDPLQFRRGDVDFSGGISITDPISILRSLFQGTGPFDCPDAADADDSGAVDIDDAILLLGFIFLGLDPPADPWPLCGVDGQLDDLPNCNGPGCQNIR